MSLATILSNSDRPPHPLVVFQSSAAESCIPILRDLIQKSKSKGRTLVFCLLYPPASLADCVDQNVCLLDYRDNIQGYALPCSDQRERIFETVNAAPSGRLNVVIDSVDTLAFDVGSVSQTYHFIRELFDIVCSRSDPSRLILHLTTPSPLIPLLTQPTLSPSLAHIVAHPPELLIHLATAYLSPPPPISPPAKFWGVFIPVSEREHESDQLVLGSGAVGRMHAGRGEDIVAEVLIRAGSDGSARRGVERALEGWSLRSGPCELSCLQSLKDIFSRKVIDRIAPDPTTNISFNLNLTPAQQESRSQVPLPYAHEGNDFNFHPRGKPPSQGCGSSPVIIYDPDSADDIDDDDPDEDLDI